MREKIFGYDMDDILRAQQGGRLARKVDVSRPVAHTVTDGDRALLAKYGSIDALKAAGFFGSADRLERATA